MRPSLVAQFAHLDVSPIVLIIRSKIALSSIFGNGSPARKKKRRWKAALLPTRRVLLRGGAFGVALKSITSGQPGVRLRMSLALRGGTYTSIFEQPGTDREQHGRRGRHAVGGRMRSRN
jgi:hypothetical protein